MNLEIRQKLAREPFAEKILKVGRLIRLAKTNPRVLQKRHWPVLPGKEDRQGCRKRANERGLADKEALKKATEEKVERVRGERRRVLPKVVSHV